MVQNFGNKYMDTFYSFFCKDNGYKGSGLDTLLSTLFPISF